MSQQPISVAVIGAGMAGRSHAAAYRMVGTVFGVGLPPIRLASSTLWPGGTRTELPSE